jgi:hypothetical protein
MMSESSDFLAFSTRAFLLAPHLLTFVESSHIALCGRIVLCHPAWHVSACNRWLHEAFTLRDKKSLPFFSNGRLNLRALLIGITI